MTSSLRDLKVYTTYPHSCSYLEDQEAVTLFVDPRTRMDARLYSRLSSMGFRRSGAHVYRPYCAQCSACIPARLPVGDFTPSRSQKRNMKANAALDVVEHSTVDDDVHYELYRRYIEARHSDGDMYPPDREQFISFLSQEWNVTRYFSFFDGGKLLATAVVDELDDGLSAIYTYYDPEEEHRGLGKYAILWQIELARKMNLPYLYLGYWIKECDKMAYKTEYRPVELYINNRWTALL